MKSTLLIVCIFCLVLIACVFMLMKETKRAQQSEKHLKEDARLRQDSIRMYRIKEAVQSKRIDFFMLAYNNAKDSLEIERGKVKVKYVEYKRPINIDLSSDNKRDSVIEQLVK